MTEAEAHTAIKVTLAVMSRIADRTRTPADNLMIQILQTSEAKLAAAVRDLANDPNQPPTAERVTAALNAVGITV